MVGQWMIPAAAVIILLIGFYGLRQSVIFSSEEKWGKPSSEKDSPSGSSKTQETTSQIFTSEELIQWKDRLEKFTREEKPYLDPRLHLIGLSGKLRLKPYQVSEILNRGMGASFYEYINRFRVEEVKRRLMDPQLAHLSILGIAMDCGFNSKSVFNETFRKYTSMTPSQFRTASS
jgi:AraC-like DNA-binding protein